ncbi:MAG: hypothetical protein J4G14_08510 [Dehalococcoidia bacterium]|nr:hypothetical protein [Dehalococcoidia bacterium]
MLYITPEALGSLLPWPVGITGLLILGVVTGLSAPSAIRIWHSLGDLARLATNIPQIQPFGTWQTMVEYGLATVLLGLLFLLTLPFLVRLFTLGSLSVPLSLLLMVTPALAVGVFSFRLHLILEPAFRDTFIAEPASTRRTSNTSPQRTADVEPGSADSRPDR